VNQPPNLKARGRRLWQAVLGNFDLRDDERVLLAHACELEDQIPILDEQRKYIQSRQHRLAIARLLTQIGLSQAASTQSKSEAARALARSKWK
jgi:hypothetical protein